MHLPDKDLAGLGGSEAALSGRRKASSVPRIQCALRLKVHPAPGEVDVSERRIRDVDAFAGVESRDVECGVTIPDPDRRLVPVPLIPDATTASRPWRSDGSSSSCSYPGATSGSSGTTHIWIRSSGRVGARIDGRQVVSSPSAGCRCRRSCAAPDWDR